MDDLQARKVRRIATRDKINSVDLVLSEATRKVGEISSDCSDYLVAEKLQEARRLMQAAMDKVRSAYRLNHEMMIDDEEGESTDDE